MTFLIARVSSLELLRTHNIASEGLRPEGSTPAKKILNLS
jgi:hypothetical protein